jgi:hypothetical protein
VIDDTLIAMRARAEAKLNAELHKLREDMEKSRCGECGLTGGQHLEGCILSAYPSGQDLTG